MECVNAPILFKSQFSSRSTPNYFFPNRSRRNPLRNYGIYPGFFLKIPFSTSSSFSNGQNFRISAHFGGHSKRRNSLRKKLKEEQKVSPDTDSIDSGSNYQQFPVYLPDEIQLSGNLEENNSSSDLEKSKLSTDSVLWSKFENWVDQYKKDAEFWGIGSGPVFTVFQDVDGNVEKVSVNEDEIFRRSGNEPSFLKQEGSMDVSSKISYAKRLAGYIEKGECKVPKNSSITKIVVSGQEFGFVSGLRSAILQPHMLSKIPRMGFAIICSFFVFWLVREIFIVKNNAVELTRGEKEMLRRKMKLRMEKEKLGTGSVELLPNVPKPVMGSTVRPLLDKQELMKNISKAKASGEELRLPRSSSSLDDEGRNFNDKIQEIKEMARHARELEQKSKEVPENVLEEVSDEIEDLEIHKELHVSNFHDVSNRNSVKPITINANREASSVDVPLAVDIGSSLEQAFIDASENRDSQVSALASTIRGSGNGMKIQSDPNRRKSGTSHLMDTKEENQSCDNPTGKPLYVDDPVTVDVGSLLEGSVHASENGDSQGPPASIVEGSEHGLKSQQDLNRRDSITLQLMDTKDEVKSSDASYDETYNSKRSSAKMKPKIILTVKEAREYLSQKHVRGDLDKEPKVRSLRLDAEALEPSTDKEVHFKDSQMQDKENLLYESSIFDKTLKARPAMNPNGNSALKKMGKNGDVLQSNPSNTDEPNEWEGKYEKGDFERPRTSEEYSDVDCNREAAPVITKESWMEKNFQDFEPIVKKIGEGFRENYVVAKEKVQELNLVSEINLPSYDEDDSELEWMKDDGLREIVFQVRENELMGRDPFHMMDAADKQAFFKGLEKKVEKESGKLLNLHEYIHSRIDNLDYGADGISVYDTPEKVIPRWKGPAVDKAPAFLNNAVNRQKNENSGVSSPMNPNLEDTIQKSADTSDRDYISRKSVQTGGSKNPKTVIESSDGSSRAGKKSGKEYWQHTKKWSREFLQLYNEETDPEVKSIMRNMGKDLNRWITDKEIQETADLMTKIPKRKRRYIEKKIEKLKREMEMFGPQAVVSKYREYAEEEEDYLWWLDLPFVLCIELYTNEDGDKKSGFYSLEMAEDLKLDPKQYHVIAFEDPGDSKSFCYIIQAHMEMLGRGSAFVVARPPKDTFREAKANGFSVTVVRKGELPLNVDQTLEEVEEQISEIGSKVYHDKIMRERSVDMGSLMKGVFGSGKPSKSGRSKWTVKKLPAS
ncbi:Embryo defective [Thalictrum thalictroides]|uniref:Embryo defective n=1 Tax=Thalictrum thalictroides TaxID=46969 RepID=A0A7J6VKF3_THATH|nr:Embryo defective [Thalictrum thalictroides]